MAPESNAESGPVSKAAAPEPRHRPERIKGAPDPKGPERSRRARQRAEQTLEAEGVSSREALRELGRLAAKYPPDENLVKATLAAARHALTSLESARLIAEQIRIEIESTRADSLDAASGGARPDDSLASLLF